MRKRILVQILVILLIVTFFHYTEEYIYRAFVVKYQPYFNSDNSAALFSHTLWTFAIVVGFWIYPNKFLVNFIVGALPALIGINLLNFYHLVYFDFMHMTSLALAILTFIRYKDLIDNKLVIIFDGIFFVWAITVSLLGTNYTHIRLAREGLAIAFVWLIISGILLKVKGILLSRLK